LIELEVRYEQATTAVARCHRGRRARSSTAPVAPSASQTAACSPSVE
jgi:hypothetical protein